MIKIVCNNILETEIFESEVNKLQEDGYKIKDFQILKSKDVYPKLFALMEKVDKSIVGCAEKIKYHCMSQEGSSCNGCVFNNKGCKLLNIIPQGWEV